MITDQRLFEIKNCRVKPDETWTYTTKEFFSNPKNFVNHYVAFEDERGCNWINEDGYVLSDKRYNNVHNFSNHLALFITPHGRNWVKDNGEELSDKRYNWAGDFVGNYAPFDYKNGLQSRWGYINYLGFEFKNNAFEFGLEHVKKTHEENKPILLEMESKLFKNFPENSLKRFIFEEIV